MLILPALGFITPVMLRAWLPLQLGKERLAAGTVIEPAGQFSVAIDCPALFLETLPNELRYGAESGLVTTLIDLAGLGNLPVRQQARRMASFEKKWRYQLRRMYPATDFTWLATELLETATHALAQPDAVLEETILEDYSTIPRL